MVIGTSMQSVPVLNTLTVMGVKRIALVPNTVFGFHEEPGGPYYFESRIGKQKESDAFKQLKEMNPDVELVLAEHSFNGEELELEMSAYDVLVDCINSTKTSLAINSLAQKLDKPVVYGATNYPRGIVSVFNFKQSGSLVNFFKNNDVTQFYSDPLSAGLPALASVIGSLMVNEVVKIIGEIGNVLYNKGIVYNTLNNEFKTISFSNDGEEPDNVVASFQPPSLNKSPGLSRAITPKLLHTKIKYKETLQLIDITWAQDIQENHWNFLHIPADELIARSNQVHQDIMVILLSEDGGKARELCTILNNKGFDNLYYLEGGLSGWEMETQTLAFTYDELL